MFIQGHETQSMLDKLKDLSDIVPKDHQKQQTLNFEAQDTVQGCCFKVNRLKNLGEKLIRKTYNDEIETVCESNQVI